MYTSALYATSGSAEFSIAVIFLTTCVEQCVYIMLVSWVAARIMENGFHAYVDQKTSCAENRSVE